MRPCTCPSAAVARYRARVSGPLLDRFDLRVDVKPVDPAALVGRAGARAPQASGRPKGVLFADGDALDDEAAGEHEKGLRQIAVARERQTDRARRFGFLRAYNARIPVSALRAAVRADSAATDCLLAAARRLAISGRGVHRALRVARTFADLADKDDVTAAEMSLALSYRQESS